MSFKEVPLGHQKFAAWEGLPWLNTEKSVDGELYIGVGGYSKNCIRRNKVRN